MNASTLRHDVLPWLRVSDRVLFAEGHEETT